MKKQSFNPISHVFTSRIEFEHFFSILDFRAPLTCFASPGKICIPFLSVTFVCFIYDDSDFHYCSQIVDNVFDLVLVDDAIVTSKEFFDTYVSVCDD